MLHYRLGSTSAGIQFCQQCKEFADMIYVKTNNYMICLLDSKHSQECTRAGEMKRVKNR